MEQCKKLYYQDSLLTEFCATVAACTQQGRHWAVELNQTAFYPEGGGQPPDTGRLGEGNVLDVQEENGKIYHFVDCPLTVGSVVKGEINRQRRFDLMQQHTGEHILSGLLHGMFHTENVGFHIGEEFVTMDTDKELSPRQIAQAEWAANEIVWNNIAVECTFPDKTTLANTQYRSKKQLDGAVRIVTIKGADCCACCGTHLPFAGMVGQIKVLDWQRYKGGTRLTVVCGGRALKDYCTKTQQLRQIGGLLSVPPNQGFEGASRLAQQLNQTKAQLAQARMQWFDALCSGVKWGDAPLLLAEDLQGDSLRTLCLMLCEKTPKPCGVFAPKEGGGLAYAIGQKGGTVAQLTKEMNRRFEGKGGGKPFLTMGSLRAEFEQINQFWNEKRTDFEDENAI